MYPWGLGKYYDLYSSKGLRKLHADKFNMVAYGFFGILDILQAWFNLQWNTEEEWWKFLCVPNPFCWYFAVEMEDGFTFG